MKTVIIIIIITALHVCMKLDCYSQTDSVKIFYTKDCSITYIPGHEDKYDSDKKINWKIPVKATIDSIRELSFLNDSIMEICKTNYVKLQLNLNEIDKIKFYKGLNAWKGMVNGAVTGAFTGIILGLLVAGWTHDSTSHDYSAFLDFPLMLAPIGAVVGFVWGALNPSAEYYKYNISRIKGNKKEELTRILNKHIIKKQILSK